MLLPSSVMKKHLESIHSFLGAIENRNEAFFAAQDLLLREQREEQRLVQAKKQEIARLISAVGEESVKDTNRPEAPVFGSKRPASSEELVQSPKRIKSEPEEPSQSPSSNEEEIVDVKPDIKPKAVIAVDGKITCLLCSVPVAKKNFNDHVTVHHLDNFKAFQCKLCDYKNGKKFAILRHLKSQHKDAQSDDSNVRNLIDSVRPKINAKILECFGAPEDIVESSFQCITCDISVAESRTSDHILKDHLKEAVWTCAVDSCAFESLMWAKTEMQKHMKTAHGVKMSEENVRCRKEAFSTVVSELKEQVFRRIE